MPIIQDPRMNPGREKQYGILYVTPEEQTSDIPTGHYFYDKNRPSHSNARYFPFGYLVKIIRLQPTNIGEELINQYSDRYCNLNTTHAAIIEHLDDESVLEDHPMALFMYKVVSHGSEEQGRGLKRIEFGKMYIYINDFLNDIGGLIQIED